MLIEKDVRDKRKSWYACDRCGDKLTAINRCLVAINNIKVADLCERCREQVRKFIRGEV